MAANFPLTPQELLLRRDMGTDGDTGVQLHAKIDRIKNEVDSILTDTADMQPKLGTPATGTLAGDIAAEKAVVDLIKTDTTGVLSRLDNGTYGLSALKTAITAVDTAVAGVDTKLGTPAGASVSADIAALKAVADLTKTDTTSIISTIGAPSLGTLVADIADLSSKIGSIQNNTRTTVAILDEFELPPSGQTYYYLISLNNYNTTGGMEDPDSAPTVAVKTFEGTARSGNLVNDAHGATTTMLKDSTGQYHIFYKLVDTADANEGLLFTFTITEGGVSRVIDRVVRVVEEISSTFTASDRVTLGDILVDTADMQPKLGAPATGTLAGDIAAVKSVADGIDTKATTLVANTTSIKAELAKIESKDTNLTFDRATDSLEAIRDLLDSGLNAAKNAKFVKASKASGSLSQGGAELVTLTTVNGWNTPYANLKEIRVVPSTKTSSNFDVEIFENSASTISLFKYTGADAMANDDLRIAVDLIFVNQNASPDNNIYVKITNNTDSGSSVFNVELRGLVTQAS